jgi:ATP-binding cassette subfamily F protein uup
VRLLIGELAPDSGTVKLGANLEMATLDQKRESLAPNWTLSDALTGGGGDTVIIGDQSKHVIGYMRDFLFSPEQAKTPVTALSGGERGRLTLARALAKPSNLLVLDEPTNDLDLETLDVLEEMLADYKGTIILISHDRDFLDRIVGAVLVPEGNGRWTEYAGGYSDMLLQRGQDILQKDIVRKAEAPKSAPKRKTAAPERTTQKRKLSYNEKYALENLPAKIKKFEETIKALQSKLGDPELFNRDRSAFDETATALADAQSELATAEEEWLALEIAREEIENG